MIQGYDFLSEIAPRLAGRLPRVSIGNYPTPVTAANTSALNLTIKHDELTDECYGGNKIRKLAYALGQAIQHDATRVATFGAAGSNHALATAIQARRLGLHPLAFLGHQPTTPNIAATLNAHSKNGSEVVYWGGTRAQRRDTLRAKLLNDNERCWVIPMGGSSWMGAVGFIAAAAELRTQIEARQLPKPARIYLPMGTLGSAVGLAVGLAACGLDIAVHAVRVVDPAFVKPDRVFHYGRRLLAMCQRLDPTFSAPLWEQRLIVREEFLGEGYAHATADAHAAVTYAKQELDLTLETTYTGKALAALLADAAEQRLADQPVLFWNTYHGVAPNLVDNRVSQKPLPAELQRYVPTH